MNIRLLLKIGAVFGLLIVLLVPMALIRELVHERQMRRDEVVQDIARSAGYAQTINGPVLVVPFTRVVRDWEEARDGTRREVMREESGRLHLLPDRLLVNGKLTTSERQRGIYKARIFDAVTTLHAEFQVPAHYGVTESPEAYTFGEPVLAVGISDIRGIGNGLTLAREGQSVNFEPGTTTPVLEAGVHAPLGARDAAQPQQLSFDIGLDLQGTGSFSVMPVGRETSVNLTSDWPHPSFIGEFLPRERAISAQGFTANWQTSFFATNLQQALQQCADAGGAQQPACASMNSRTFGVSFIDPVDQYLKSERAAKYAFLFIGLTFTAFFLFEVLQRFSVHPVQYGLVGVSLALFFLLLLALAEHIGFNLAYGVAAAACVLLNGYYVSHVLGSRKRGAVFGGALALLYGLLFGIIGSEDYALLMGSLLVFGLLAAVMVLTRKVSWNAWEART